MRTRLACLLILLIAVSGSRCNPFGPSCLSRQQTGTAGTVNGVLRIREQGETIKQGYGLRPIAMRSLERAFNALSLTTSAAKRGKLVPDSPAFLNCATTLADASRTAYRALAHSGPEFFQYFRAVTPIDVIT